MSWLLPTPSPSSASQTGAAGWIVRPDILNPIPFEALFGNANRVELELGAGDGSFIVRHAAEHPECNFLAIERRARAIDPHRKYLRARWHVERMVERRDSTPDDHQPDRTLQQRDRITARSRRIDAGKRRMCRFAGRLVLTRHRRQMHQIGQNAGMFMTMAADHHIFQHRHSGKYLQILKCPLSTA